MRVLANLAKTSGCSGSFRPGLADVVGVVEPDAEHLAGIR